MSTSTSGITRNDIKICKYVFKKEGKVSEVEPYLLLCKYSCILPNFFSRNRDIGSVDIESDEIIHFPIDIYFMIEVDRPFVATDSEAQRVYVKYPVIQTNYDTTNTDKMFDSQFGAASIASTCARNISIYNSQERNYYYRLTVVEGELREQCYPIFSLTEFDIDSENILKSMSANFTKKSNKQATFYKQTFDKFTEESAKTMNGLSELLRCIADRRSSLVDVNKRYQSIVALRNESEADKIYRDLNFKTQLLETFDVSISRKLREIHHMMNELRNNTISLTDYLDENFSKYSIESLHQSSLQ